MKNRFLVIMTLLFICLITVITTYGLINYLAQNSNNQENQDIQPKEVVANVVSDYKLEEEPIRQDMITNKDSRIIRMALYTGTTGNTNGEVSFPIKNDGEVKFYPLVKFQDQVFKLPALEPNQGMDAVLNFGELEKRLYEFSVTAMNLEGDQNVYRKVRLSIQ